LSGVAAVDLGEDGFCVRLLDLAACRVVPREVEDRAVPRGGRLLEPRADLLAEVVVEPELGPAVLLGLDRLEVPLQEPLRVGERALFLDVARGRQEEDLGADLLRSQLTGLDLGAVVPERRGLDLDEVAHDEPVELGEPESLHLAVRGADRGVLAGDDVALDRAGEHLLDGPVDGVVVVDAGEIAEREVVVGRRRRAPPGLQQRHHVRAGVAPPAALGRRAIDVVVEPVVLRRVRHLEVAGEDVVQRRDVRRALDRRMAAQCDDPAARSPDVAEEQLDDRRGADVLDADRVLCPADRVGERRGSVAARVAAQRLGDGFELCDGAAARLRDDVGRVAGVVPLEDLEDAARVLERFVAFRRVAVAHPAAVRAVRRVTLHV
jgi:hypothetical protein